MGFFTKKKKIDYNTLFKDKYKSINQLTMQANNELDFTVKESLWALVVDEYNELISYIDQGADFDKEHFISLQKSAEKELDMVRNVNKDA